MRLRHDQRLAVRRTAQRRDLLQTRQGTNTDRGMAAPSNSVRPHSSLGYRALAPEAATPSLPASGSTSLHLRPAMAAETKMH